MLSLLRQLRNVPDLVYTEGLLSGLKVDAGQQKKRILRTKSSSSSHPIPWGCRETQGSFLRTLRHVGAQTVWALLPWPIRQERLSWRLGTAPLAPRALALRALPGSGQRLHRAGFESLICLRAPVRPTRGHPKTLGGLQALESWVTRSGPVSVKL